MVLGLRSPDCEEEPRRPTLDSPRGTSGSRPIGPERSPASQDLWYFGVPVKRPGLNVLPLADCGIISFVIRGGLCSACIDVRSCSYAFLHRVQSCGSTSLSSEVQRGTHLFIAGRLTEC